MSYSKKRPICNKIKEIGVCKLNVKHLATDCDKYFTYLYEMNKMPQLPGDITQRSINI
jgi:hypothetical protein